jgi:hypothetical protein
LSPDFADDHEQAVRETGRSTLGDDTPALYVEELSGDDQSRSRLEHRASE